MKSPVVGVDCSPLLMRSAGVKTYLYHWVNAMRGLNAEAIRTFLAPSGRGGLLHEAGVWANPLRIAALVALNKLPPFVCGAMAPRCDIFHVSNQLRSVPRRRRLTTTLHDLTAWILPECHTAAMVAADKVFGERVLKRADGLIAVSENTKRDAVRILGIAPDKIRVIHLGVPASYRSARRESIARRPYFLYVGTIEPRKNVDSLLTAWQSLPSGFRGEYELIIAGMPGWNSSATMRRLVQGDAGVRYLGYVPEADLPALTAGAEAVVYPSLYEGFGIPVAQAMAAGCPVITSNVSSLPEITGGAAILIDPRSVDELRAAILRVGESAELRACMRAKGIEQAARFTWEAAAAESLRYFAEIA